MNNITDALYQAAGLTFEELGFLFPIRENSSNAVKNFSNSVTINFHGDCNGKIILNVSPELLPIIAENILGDDEAPSQEMQIDALGEVANVICGNALPMIFGKTSIIRLDPPKHSEFSQMQNSTSEIRLGFEEGQADVLFYLSEGK